MYGVLWRAKRGVFWLCVHETENFVSFFTTILIKYSNRAILPSNVLSIRFTSDLLLSQQPLHYSLSSSFIFSFSVHGMHFCPKPNRFLRMARLFSNTTLQHHRCQYNTDRADVGTGPKVRGEDRLCGAPVRGRIPPAKNPFQGLPRLLLDDPGPGQNHDDHHTEGASLLLCV